MQHKHGQPQIRARTVGEKVPIINPMTFFSNSVLSHSTWQLDSFQIHCECGPTSIKVAHSAIWRRRLGGTIGQRSGTKSQHDLPKLVTNPRVCSGGLECCNRTPTLYTFVKNHKISNSFPKRLSNVDKRSTRMEDSHEMSPTNASYWKCVEITEHMSSWYWEIVWNIENMSHCVAKKNMSTW